METNKVYLVPFETIFNIEKFGTLHNFTSSQKGGNSQAEIKQTDVQEHQLQQQLQIQQLQKHN